MWLGVLYTAEKSDQPCFVQVTRELLLVSQSIKPILDETLVMLAIDLYRHFDYRYMLAE